MPSDRTKRDSHQDEKPPREVTGVQQPETTPDQERGERLDTGKAIARGGKDDGHVPGAEPDGEQEQ